MSEQVLVFPTDTLKALANNYDKYGKTLVVSNHRVARSVLAHIFASGRMAFMDRPAAEVDPSYKQLIPYCIFLHRDCVFMYQRTNKAGDARLHNLYSVGVGGHINPSDGDIGANAYDAAFWRELAEEVNLTQKYQNEIRGLIYIPEGVHQVHFGVVHVFRLPPTFDRSSFDLKKDPALAKGEWQYLSYLKQNEPSDGKFERWSRLALDHIV